ncbi:MAG: hypothetical protein H0T76_13540 [Nannocystis sp.]|nr:hypothetical protein [Nannocystis sp.]MBA3547505.1 hypothetical protein [Nannocystis sp.]
MSRRVQVVVLCEDLQSATLLRQYLYLRGFPRRSVRVEALPASSGCGSQGVRERYAEAVHANRTRHVAEALVVHIDADNHSVDERHTELAKVLAAAGQAPRANEEAIAIVVPRWETETWLHHFLGRNSVLESHRGYPKFAQQHDAATPTAKALLDCVRNITSPPANLPSFATAVAELARLP